MTTTKYVYQDDDGKFFIITEWINDDTYEYAHHCFGANIGRMMSKDEYTYIQSTFEYYGTLDEFRQTNPEEFI